MSTKLGAKAGSAVERLRAQTPAALERGAVDMEREVIMGAVVAQEGPFKSDGRGEFDRTALEKIVELASNAPGGLPCHFTHADISNDGLGKFLGEWKNFRMSTVGVRVSECELKTDPVACVRADLHISPTSHDTPSGDLGAYVLKMAKTHPNRISSSLVLRTDMEYRLDRFGRPECDADGIELPPLWRPTRLMGSDVVRVGDAVDGLLSAADGGEALQIDGLPDVALYRAEQLMNTQFAGKDRAFVEGHCRKWLGRYLDRRYGSENVSTPQAKPTQKTSGGERRTILGLCVLFGDAIESGGQWFAIDPQAVPGALGCMATDREQRLAAAKQFDGTLCTAATGLSVVDEEGRLLAGPGHCGIGIVAPSCGCNPRIGSNAFGLAVWADVDPDSEAGRDAIAICTANPLCRCPADNTAFELAEIKDGAQWTTEDCWSKGSPAYGNQVHSITSGLRISKVRLCSTTNVDRLRGRVAILDEFNN